MGFKGYISRYNILWIVFTVYFLPVVSLIVYNVFLENNTYDWNALSFGIFLSSIGTLFFFLLLTYWTKQFETSPSKPLETNQSKPLSETVLEDELPPQCEQIDPEAHRLLQLSLDEAQKAQMRLLDEVDHLTNELSRSTADRKQVLTQIERSKDEFDKQQRDSTQHLEQQQRYIRDLQRTIAEQKAAVEHKQQQIELLESKVNDLSHEIKSMLQFAESRTASILSSTRAEASPIPQEHHRELTPQHVEERNIQPNQEAHQLLRRCIDISQKIRGSQRFGSQLYSFLDSPSDAYTLDLRRLCDRLRGETNGAILLYSPKENQMLFASNQVKELTGWSPEKFVQNFSELLHDTSAWRVGLDGLETSNEAQARLSVASRSGPPVALSAYLGMIPSGIFRNHVIAVVEP